MRPTAPNARAHSLISSICPVAAAAWRAATPAPPSFSSRARPATIAPEVTTTTSRPARTIASISTARRAIISGRKPPASETTALPILTTTRRA